jgi:hypothetical protein
MIMSAILVGVILRRLDLHPVGDDRLKDLLQEREHRRLKVGV